MYACCCFREHHTLKTASSPCMENSHPLRLSGICSGVDSRLYTVIVLTSQFSSHSSFALPSGSRTNSLNHQRRGCSGIRC
ncbi:hypothetical protein M413DRAFT_199326 [Hebeloma cylindrosporum]|uniref:Uncharacterized protein n=1 Tax=Hebeloma cylindrosporum TaxID=76867 RepID=A0A0C3CU31_HEBCY|nr:hypothetical protein M413DRAFT_199326 [Hebeloma cylindrosporum h7]